MAGLGSGTNYIPSPKVGQDSALNNSTTPLAASATFTGSAEKNDYSDVGVSCFSDTAGTLFFDFSVDGTNWNTFPVAGFSVAANIHEFHTAVKLGRYFRVRFVNGTSAQTTFRLFVYYGSFKTPNSPMNSQLSSDSDAINCRTTWPQFDISRNLYSNITTERVFGRNDNVGTSFVPISIGGLLQMPTTASTLRVKAGGNANDTAAGTGARTILLQGVDANNVETFEFLTTAGAAASAASTTAYSRLISASVFSSGTYASATAGSHAGDITIEDSAGANDWAMIDSTDYPRGRSEGTLYTVPAGKNMYLNDLTINVSSNKAASVIGLFRTSRQTVAAPYTAAISFVELDGVEGQQNFSGKIPAAIFPAGTDIYFLGKLDSGSGGFVSVFYEMTLVDA